MSDTRIWLHVNMSEAQPILVMSPDTDFYHIGLTQTEKEVIVQINTYSAQSLQFLHFTNHKCALECNPDLSTIEKDLLPKIFQTLYVSTTYRFSAELAKLPFSATCTNMLNSLQVGWGAAIGILANTELNNGFLRLVGTVYYKMHNTGFETPNPITHLNSLHKPNTIPALHHHHQWIEASLPA